MAPEAKKLIDIVARIVEMRRGISGGISPSWVATEGMQIVDPERISPELVYLGCHLQLRQIARSLLREWFEGDFEEDQDGTPAQHDLFPHLQQRYPVKRKHGDEPVYMRLEELTDEDLRFNIKRLRREANAKLAHARALEAFANERVAAA